jgi:CheY-like chemotaxis protein
VVALTASSFDEQREEILAAGCDDFMRKPFNEDALLDTLARRLSLRYRFEDANTAPMPTQEPDKAQLAALPSPLRQQLDVALKNLDVEAIEHAIAAMRTHDGPLADAMARMAKRFQYERLRALLG